MNVDKIVCPISGKRVSVNVPRLNALVVIGFTAAYLLSNEVWIIGFLVLDFTLRGCGLEKFSLVARLSNYMDKIVFPGNKNMIDVSPKIFAARLGLMVTFFVVAFHLMGIGQIAQILASMLVLFAFLECFLNFCVGCWVFTLFVKPFYSVEPLE
ncbi:DUF4395 domain-containing protein [Plebeiibacterium marinum]|uniref:DUF4395 domain-containing protein n=1 Tax=Plebeiibacterium marinum TaxID=2992111 RepID=A0AAE3SIJ1_9BACT|nr:DUF4395 domain-containing protein [Plebeiobacterium marinum]MCW3804444.1 DUF4395 domain-containing protein [Plebeiobacterium marinum]